jgi:hypothetical protein
MQGTGSQAGAEKGSVEGLAAWCHTGAPRSKEFTHRWNIPDFKTKARGWKVG